MRLQSLHVRNFKAIVDSKVVKLGPLTAFIGNNGAGKSSLIEALETYQHMIRDGLDAAMQHWMGIEHARHKGQEAKERTTGNGNPIGILACAGHRRVRVEHKLNETLSTKKSALTGRCRWSNRCCAHCSGARVAP